MNIVPESRVARMAPARAKLTLPRWTVEAVNVGLELATLFALSIATGVAYHAATYGEPGPLEAFVRVGALTAVLRLGLLLLSNGGDATRIDDDTRPSASALRDATVIFVALVLIGFLTKTTGHYSRGWLALYFAAGVVGLAAVRTGARAAVRTAKRVGLLPPLRLFLFGTRAHVLDFFRRSLDDGSTNHVAATSILPPLAEGDDPDAAFTDELAHAVACARALAVDDVLILMSWSEIERIEHAVEAFEDLPVGLYVGPGGKLLRIRKTEVARFGETVCLQLARAPLTPLQRHSKRAFDVVVALAALVCLAPVLAAVAVAIKLETPGPVLFRQRRHGFNRNVFHIFKFRTMTSLDDGDRVTQAVRNDPRVTRVGRFLRRWNIDEVPQLVNVLRGEMSLVGPRPHALAHDNLFEQRIARYARRHKVMPGITGWAQANGLRGETDTNDKILRRVEHDLYYIENWSLLLDLRILAMTVFLPRAYRNAL